MNFSKFSFTTSHDRLLFLCMRFISMHEKAKSLTILSWDTPRDTFRQSFLTLKNLMNISSFTHFLSHYNHGLIQNE